MSLRLRSFFPVQITWVPGCPVSTPRKTKTFVRNQIPVFKVVACQCIDRFTLSPTCMGWQDIIKDESEAMEIRRLWTN